MPYYKRRAASRKYVRKPYRKYAAKKAVNRVTNRGTMVYRGNPGIADRGIIKMCYRDNYVLTSGAPSPFLQRAWKLNSIYDPDSTGIGHQPLTYDQWGLFYLSYRVYKVDVVLHLANQESVGVQVGWTVQPDDNSIANNDAAFEQPHTFSKLLGGVAGQNRAMIKRTVNLPRILGQQSKQYRANENTYSTWYNDPNTKIYGILFAESIDNSTIPNVSVSIDLVFHVEMFDRKEATISTSGTEHAQQQLKVSFAPTTVEPSTNVST